MSIEIDISSDNSVGDPDYVPTSRKRRINILTASDEQPAAKRRYKALPLQEKTLFNGKYFHDLLEEGNGKIAARCTKCQSRIQGFDKVSSNFLKHLRRCDLSTYNEYISESGTSSSSAGISKKRQQGFDDDVIDIIVENILPISIVQSASFKKAFLRFGADVKSRPTIVKLMGKRFEKMVLMVKNEIKANNFFCTAADIWSTKHRSFFGYTCHWLNAKFERKSAVLACRRFSGIHSAEKIAQMISEIHSAYGLDHCNVVTTITDNGSNFVKAFREFGITAVSNPAEYCSSLDNHLTEAVDDENSYEHNEVPENILPTHTRCASHTLNLLGSADFLKIIQTDKCLYNRHVQTLQKCNNLWRKSSWPKSSEVIKNALGCSLLTPSATRWNSLYDSVSKLMMHISAINEISHILSIPRFLPHEIQYLEEFCHVMKPLAVILDYLQGENKIFFGALLPALVSLRVKWSKVSSMAEVQLLKSTVEQLQKKLVARFRAYFFLEPEADLAVVAAVLTPTIKMKWFTTVSKIALSKSVDDVYNSVVKTVKNLPELSRPNSDEEEEQIEVDSILEFEEESNDTVLQFERSPGQRCAAKIKDQLIQYLNDPRTDWDVWTKYETLRPLAIWSNTPITSSAPVERLFSYAGLVNTPQRNSLSDENFERLVLMKANSNNSIC